VRKNFSKNQFSEDAEKLVNEKNDNEIKLKIV
jgi:hypothetical protein